MSDRAELVRLLQAGMAHHGAGRFHEAEVHYRRALAIDPDDPEALHLLGVIASKAGHAQEAAGLIRRALSFRPDYPEAHNNLGAILKGQGRPGEAILVFREALRYRANFPEAHYNLACSLAATGQWAEARDHLEHCLRLKPDFEPAQRELRSVQQALGQQRPRAAPTSADVFFANANALIQSGRLIEAVDAFKQGLTIQPMAAGAWNDLGNVLQDLGRLDESATAYRRALQLNPQYADALNNLGNLYQRANRLDEAVKAYESALAVQPNHLPAHGNLGVVYKDLGRLDLSAQHLQAAIAIRPSTTARLLLATLLPPVYASLEDVALWRGKLERNLASLARDQLAVDLTNEVVPNLFYLAYQGQDDRHLQKQYAEICRAANRGQLEMVQRPAKRDRIHVGIISKYLRDHTIGTLMRGLFATLDRREFHVTALPFDSGRDSVLDFIRQHTDQYVVVPDHLSAARRVIAEQNLDILLYADIGMDPIAYTLAFSRLAPVQCVTWGHPVTSGLPAIDYFISSDLVEPEDGQDHYTESLVRLPTLPFYYYRPRVPTAAKSMAALGLEEGHHLYGCLQTLFKFHPDIDILFAGILRGDPLGRLVLLRGKHSQWEEALRDRWQRTLSDVIDRIIWLPPQPRDEFLALMAACDVLLDTPHFSGGNTSYEAMALGIPTVTWPGRYMKGRLTYGLYRKMGYLDCVAANPDEYIACALRLGTDREARLSARRAILDSSGALFEDIEAPQAWGKFFREAYLKAGG